MQSPMTDIKNTTNQKEEPDLYKRSIKGGYWVFALRFATMGLELVKSIIVVNCLMLENLGLIAIAIMLMEILNTFSESGINAALVQKKEDITNYLNTAWVISIIRGIVLFVVLYFTAPLFASFKVSDGNISLAISVIRVMGLCLLISGFRNIGAVHFQKNMEFHKTFWIGLAGTLTDIVLSIGLVLIYRSVWGFVIARLVSACVSFVLSYLLCPYRPKFHFEREKAKELWKFGKWIFGGRILGFILGRGDDFFVWFYLGLPQLALYVYAFRFSSMPATHISQVIAQVTFPAYSKIQNDLPRLRDAYLKVLKITALFSVPTAFLIFILGPDFVHLFLKEHMHPITLALQILALKGLLKSLGAQRSALFRALGKPQVNMHFHWFRLGILALTIYPLTKILGIAGTAISTTLTSIIVNPFGFHLACKLLQCTIWKMFQQYIFPLCGSIIMLIVLFILRHIWDTPISHISFFSFGLLGIITYLFALLVLDYIFDYGFREMIIKQIQLFRNKVDR